MILVKQYLYLYNLVSLYLCFRVNQKGKREKKVGGEGSTYIVVVLVRWLVALVVVIVVLMKALSLALLGLEDRG